MCALVGCYCNSFSRSKFTKYPVLRWFSKEIGFGTLHLVHLNHGLIARWIESKTRFTPWYLKFSSSPYQTNVLRRKKDQNNLKTVFRFFKELTFICCGLLLFFFSYPRHVWGKMRTECKFLFYFWTFSKKKMSTKQTMTSTLVDFLFQTKSNGLFGVWISIKPYK